jgi:hypothetical protein
MPIYGKILGAIAVLAFVAGLGWFGGNAIAQVAGSDEDFIPHANACVNKWGFILVKDTCSKWEKPLLIASEEKVDQLRSDATTYVREVVSSDATTANFAEESVSCDSGDQATGGGAWLDVGSPGNTGAGDNVALQASYPQNNDVNPTDGGTVNGWRAFARELQNVPADAVPQTQASGASHTPVEGWYGTQMTWGNFSGGEATYTSATGASWYLHVYVICNSALEAVD